MLVRGRYFVSMNYFELTSPYLFLPHACSAVRKTWRCWRRQLSEQVTTQAPGGTWDSNDPP